MHNSSPLFLIGMALLMGFLLAIASPARANLDDELKSSFSDMINVTTPGSYETQRRGVITGGSLITRNKIVNPNLISFVPPSVKSGCNGIDLFGGSFSFINGAQFTQLARSIAQAAVGYAFQLAIEGMCPTCAQVISKLQSEIEKINALMRNSCEAGKAIVNTTGLQNWSRERKDHAAGVNTGLGFVDDYFNAKETSTDTPAKTLIVNGKEDEITGNVVYEAMETANVSSWFAHGDKETKMVMMSLTGTLIISKKDDNSDVKYDTRPALIGVREFTEGGDVKIYKCESAKCLLPDGDNTEIINFTGLRARTRKMIFGTGTCAACTGGIVRKLANRNGGDAFTNDEKKFIEATSPGVLSLLKSVGTEQDAAALVGDKSIDIVTTELTHQMIDEMYDTIESAVTATGRPLDSSMLKVMNDKRGQIRESRRVAAESVAGVQSIVTIQKSVRESLRSYANNKTH